jgi:signal transduction histidine kinase
MVALAAAVVTTALWLRSRSRVHDLERRLEDTRERLEASRAARNTFFDLVTHELRSPLTAILGYQELLRDGAYGSFDDGAMEAIERIGRSARHLLHLIDGLVELSRLRSGGLRPSPGPVNLGAVVPPVVDAFRSHLRERGLEPHVHAPDHLPTLRSDQDRLVRILDLVITSAVRHPANDALTLDIETDHGLAVRVHELAAPVRDESDDPAIRLGIRLAVASGLARLLGGRLVLDPPDGPVIRRIALHLPDMGPTLGDEPVTL